MDNGITYVASWTWDLRMQRWDLQQAAVWLSHEPRSWKTLELSAHVGKSTTGAMMAGCSIRMGTWGRGGRGGSWQSLTTCCVQRNVLARAHGHLCADKKSSVHGSKRQLLCLIQENGYRRVDPVQVQHVACSRPVKGLLQLARQLPMAAGN